MTLRFAIFFFVLLTLLGALNFYVHRRASRSLGLSRTGRLAFALLLAAGLGTMIGVRMLGKDAGPELIEALSIFGSTVQLSVVISGALLLLWDLGRLLGRTITRVRDRFFDRPKEIVEDARGGIAATPTATPKDEPPPGLDLARREFLGRSVSGAALVVGSGHSVYGALLGRHDYVIEEVPVRIAGLSPRLDGFTIVQLSDIHFGTFVREREIGLAVDLVRKAKPDLVVLTGDLVDHDPRYAPMLGRLTERLAPLARHGVVAAAGNHDYYAGIDTVLDVLRRGGASVLRNGGQTVGDAGGAFALLGVDDVWGPRYGLGPGPDLERALSMVPKDLPRVLLCHNPVFFPEAAARVQLQLSGHTHGGQVNVGPRLAGFVLPYGYVEGIYTRDGGTLYVNRGFGTAGPPARIGAPPEVSRIVLTAG